MEVVKNIKPNAYGPIPLTKLLILGGIACDDDEIVNDPAGFGQRNLRDSLPCIVLNFTNSNETPTLPEAEESKDSGKKQRKKRNK